MSRCEFNPIKPKDRTTAQRIWEEINNNTALTEVQKTDEFVSRLQKEFSNSSDIVAGLADSFGIGLSFSEVGKVVYRRDSLQEEEDRKIGRILPTTQVNRSVLVHELDFDSLWYNNLNARVQMVKNFKERIVESSLWNRNSNIWYNSNDTAYMYGKRLPISIINANLIRFKCEAIERIMRKVKSNQEYKDQYQNLFVNRIINADNRLDENEFKVLVLQAIDEAHSYMTSNFDLDGMVTDSEILSDYALLKYFDNLIEKHTPFIKIKPSYKNTESFEKYEYVGGTVEHFFNFSTDESADISEQASDLSSVLLDYIPMVDDNGNDIANSSIGVNTFQHILSALKSAIKNKTFYGNKNYKHILTKQIDAKQDFIEFVNAYKKEVRYNEKYYTPFRYELNSVIKYIFNENTNDDMFNMFFNMMMKQEQSDYVEVGFNNMTNTITASLISSRTYDENGYMLANILACARKNLADTHEKFANIFGGLGYQKPLNVTIGTESYELDFGENKKVAFKLSKANNGVLSISELTIPNDMELSDIIDYCNQYYQCGFPKQAFIDYYGSDLMQGKKDFMSFFITGMLEVSRDRKINEIFNFSTYRNLSLKPLAVACGVVYGQGKSSTYKNNQGNQIPANQLGCMAEKTDMITQLISDHVNHNDEIGSPKTNPYAVANILYNNPKFFDGVARCGSIDINGIKRSVTDMSYNELQNVALLYKFLDPIGREKQDLMLQPTTFSDKSTQFDVLINPDNYLYLKGVTPALNTDGAESVLVDSKNKPLTIRKAVKAYLENPNSEHSQQIYNSLKEYLWISFVAKTFSKAKNVFFDYLHAFQEDAIVPDILLQDLTADIIYDDPSFWVNNENLRNENGEFDIDSKLRIANTMMTNIQNVLTHLDGRGLSKSDITRLFFENGLDFIQNVHYEDKRKKVNGKDVNYITVNSTDLQGTKFTKSTFDDYIEFQQNIMARTMYKGGVEVIKDYIPKWLKYSDWVKGKDNIWFNKRNQMYFRRKKTSIQANNINDSEASTEQDQIETNETEKEKYSKDEYVVNPILKIYSLVNAIFANDFNELHIGDPNIHGAKVSDSELNDLEKQIKSEYKSDDIDSMIQVQKYSRMRSARIVTQNKRAVPETTTVHSYLHGGTYHIPSTVKMALIDSVKGYTHLPYGEEKDMFAQDGGAWSITYARYLENWSLEDSAGGRDRKTILPGMKSDYMGAQLGKWAVFDMDNERRRMGYNSRSSIENLVRKATSLQWADNLDANDIIDNFVSSYSRLSDQFYFKDIDGRYGEPGTYYLISDFEGNGDGTITCTIIPSNEFGETNEDESKTFTSQINSLYDLDQVLGGAFVMELNYDLNKLVYTEKANEFMARFICENNLKDQFIYYIADKEAVKVGITNVNTIEDYKNPNKDLMYTTVSTMFSGLIMNAEHESDATVSEMSQMINLLDQNGVMHDEVYELYEEIGRIVDEALKPYIDGINSSNTTKNKDKLYRLIGKAVIESLKNNDRDTVDLAKTFVVLANNSLKEANIEYKLPFSAASINSNFIATISSDIVKNVIRRRYFGMQGVLTPSHDMIMVYKDANGKTFLFDEYIDELHNKYYDQYRWNDIKPWWKQLMEEEYLIDINGDPVKNPLIQSIPRNELQFGDTIIVDHKAIIIDKISLYDQYKHIEALDDNIIKVHRGYPRNLGQCQFTYQVEYHDTTKRFDEYSLDSNRIAFILRNSEGNEFTIQDAIMLGAKVDADSKIIEDGKDSLFMRLRKIIFPDVNDTKPLFETSKATLIRRLERETQRMLKMLASTRSDSKDVNNVLPMQFSWKDPGKETDYNPDEQCVVKELQFNPFEIIMSKQHAVEFGLKPGDTLNQVIESEERHKDDGKGYFYSSIRSSFKDEKIQETHLGICDAVIWINDEPVIVKVVQNKKDETLDTETLFNKALDEVNKKSNDADKLTSSVTANKFSVLNGTLYCGDEEFLPSSIVKSYRLYNNDIDYDCLVVNNWRDFYRIIYNSNVRFYKRKYNSRSFKYEKNKGFLPNNLKSHTEANRYENDKFDNKMIEMGRDRYQAFMKSLEMLGTRIPSSSMQSFSIMKVVAQVDSGLNDVYVPTAINLISGSDFKRSILESLNFVNCWEA